MGTQREQQWPWKSRASELANSDWAFKKSCAFECARMLFPPFLFHLMFFSPSSCKTVAKLYCPGGIEANFFWVFFLRQKSREHYITNTHVLPLRTENEEHFVVLTWSLCLVKETKHFTWSWYFPPLPFPDPIFFLVQNFVWIFQSLLYTCVLDNA